MSKIIFEGNNSVGTITLNNQSKLNAFEPDMMQELDKALDEIKNSELKVVVINGKGPHFCAGGDIEWEMQAGNLSETEAKKQISFVQGIMSKVEELPQATIAVINGHAVGGGNELAMACDIRVALQDAKFTHPETSLGTVAPLGGTKRLPRLIGLGKAKYMLFTGSTIDGKKALEWGLVDFLVDKENLNDFMGDLTSNISKKPIKALELTKKSVNEEYHKDLSDKFEAEAYVKCSRSKENKELLKTFMKNKDLS
jgi:enoyl-CoA hydratase/carnithine racemase